MWVQLQAPDKRGWQPHTGMIMVQEWQGQWFVPPSPASGEEEEAVDMLGPSSQAVQDEVMEDYGSEEGKAKSLLEVLHAGGGRGSGASSQAAEVHGEVHGEQSPEAERKPDLPAGLVCTACPYF